MPNYAAPGVYVEEVASSQKVLTAAPTAVAAFVGFTEKAPTDDPKARHCESCQQHVHYCNSLVEARHHSERGHCVALSLALVRRPNDLFRPSEIPTGIPVPVTPPPPEAIAETLLYDLPAAPAPQWVPAPGPPSGRVRRTPRRKRRRSEHRNIQRENWEGEG